jgi:hypothetical protein
MSKYIRIFFWVRDILRLQKKGKDNKRTTAKTQRKRNPKNKQKP